MSTDRPLFGRQAPAAEMAVSLRHSVALRMLVVRLMARDKPHLSPQRPMPRRRLLLRRRARKTDTPNPRQPLKGADGASAATADNVTPGAAVESSTFTAGLDTPAAGPDQVIPVEMPSGGSFDSDTTGATIACGFTNGLDGWTIEESGGSDTGQGGVVADNGSALLTEGDSFVVSLERTFEVPEEPNSYSFTYSDLSFDTTDTDFINDAFEAALIDADGNSLVHTIAPEHDVFFNKTDGEPIALGPGATIDGQTVTLDVSHLFPGTSATVVFRLVNNDRDVDTSVRIVGVQCPSSGVNNPPVAHDDQYATDEDTTVTTGNVLANDTDVDGDALTIVAFDATSAAGGTVVDNTDGTFDYTPPQDFNGSDTFSHTIDDGRGATAEATVTMTVNSVNDAPTAVVDAYVTEEDTARHVDPPGVLSNDTDVDVDSLTALLEVGPSNGALTLSDTGSFTYTPKRRLPRHGWLHLRGM